VIKFGPFIVVSALFLLCGVAFAQEEKKKENNENVFLHPKKFYRKYFPNLKIKTTPTDSLYIQSYPNYLSVSTHVLSPSIRLDLSPHRPDGPGTSKFRTNISDIVGFNVSYRFISAGFALMLNSGAQMHDNYAKSQYRTATINYSSRAWTLQYQYLRYKGLTDVNTDEYVRRPDIVNKEYQFQGVYNPGWRKYSYLAPSRYSQRQLKSRAGILFKTGAFYTQLSGDSTLIGSGQQQYFDGNLKDVSVIRSLSIKLAPGAGGTWVFLKRYYVSMAAFSSYDLLFYKYLTHQNEKVKGKQSFVFALDGEASIGYHSKRMYAGFRYEFERKQASLYSLRTTNLLTYLGLEFGYRFDTPRFIKKVYKETMPPGM
jgi:hypothetical protein